jgi:2-polyprenyl-3-methyl-5-hydroxy-6-metoxy-1,4-benzoquinol methylase
MVMHPELIQTERPCPISKSKDAWVVSNKDRHGEKLRNVMSSKSGMVFVDPVPFENTEGFYKTEYRKAYKGVHQPKPKHVYRAGKVALDRFSRIEPLINDSSICLDAGSSSGEFVYLLRKKGYDAQGAEANEPYAEFSRKELGVPVSISPFSQFKPKEEFDLITMFHVLEHLENPVQDLSHLGRYLRIGGRMIIEVPNILYPDMAFSNKWHPGHLFSFTEHTLPSLMKVAGFDVVRCKTLGDGGNLWGEFVKTQATDVIKMNLSLMPNESFAALKMGKSLYYFRIRNYLKFIPKSIRQIREKIKSKNKSPRMILDELYQSQV